MRIITSVHSRPYVRGEEPHPRRGGPVYAKHSGSKGVNLEKYSTTYDVIAVPGG